MLIINADDLGRNRAATDNILESHKKGTVTAASIMLFMADSERAAQRAAENNLDTGVHLNFAEEFTGTNLPQKLVGALARTKAFLSKGRFSMILYNPMLKKEIRYLVASQCEEFSRLFGRPPERFDGHHHHHLCMNMVVDHPLPQGSLMRRNFRRWWQERGISPIWTYRGIIDKALGKHYRIVDYLCDLKHVMRSSRNLDDVLDVSKKADIELFGHPEKPDQLAFLTGDTFPHVIETTHAGPFTDLPALKNHA